MNTDKVKRIVNAVDCINEAIYWLEQTMDGTSETREDVITVMTQGICVLQEAYTRMMFDTIE